MSNIVIEMSELSLGYGGKPVIADASAVIEAKDFVFIVGKSGSGKSTLLKSFYGEIPPEGGKLNICGLDMKDITSSKLNTLRRHMGIVFQDYKLINEWTVEKNVMLPLIVNGFPKAVCINQAQKLLKHVRLL
ncbi:MAG: ATP-binding cassette domain-containing protein, partial [Campylobacteraceae bacterium]|nr:ATP-binding cassette domain-containing protein [Campylobacteraceae bacterium]